MFRWTKSSTVSEAEKIVVFFGAKWFCCRGPVKSVIWLTWRSCLCFVIKFQFENIWGFQETNCVFSWKEEKRWEIRRHQMPLTRIPRTWKETTTFHKPCLENISQFFLSFLFFFNPHFFQHFQITVPQVGDNLQLCDHKKLLSIFFLLCKAIKKWTNKWFLRLNEYQNKKLKPFNDPMR